MLSNKTSYHKINLLCAFLIFLYAYIMVFVLALNAARKLLCISTNHHIVPFSLWIKMKVFVIVYLIFFFYMNHLITPRYLLFLRLHTNVFFSWWVFVALKALFWVLKTRMQWVALWLNISDEPVSDNKHKVSVQTNMLWLTLVVK